MKKAKAKARANRNHKDSVFARLFGTPDKALELYCAISGKRYPKSTKVRMITLSNVLFMGKMNDICFVVENKLVVLIEHQSTINENICLRMLMYIAREYEKITKSSDLYKENRIKIPAPEFIILYNGKKPFPDFKEMRLSDSFAQENDACFLELVAKVYNINKGRNAEIASRSPALDGYGTFIAEIKKHERRLGLAGAIKKAVRTCMSKKILLSFLRENASEVENMLLTDKWDWDEALAVRYKEGIEKGIERGLERGKKRGIAIGETRGIAIGKTRGIAIGEARGKTRGIAIGKTRGIAIGETRGHGEVFALLERGLSLAEVKKKLGYKR